MRVEQFGEHRTRQASERSETAAWLDRVWVERDLVWPSETGTPLSLSNLRRYLHVTDSIRQSSAGAIHRSSTVEPAVTI